MTTQDPLTLSTTKPDFESIIIQLQLYLKAKGTWNDLFAQDVGETLLEIVAAGIAMNQMGAEVAQRETYLTAVRDSSIYEITNMLGVRVTRKTPANVTVRLERSLGSPTDVIPPMSIFTVDGVPFFNKSSFVFDNNGRALGHLFEGSIKTQALQGSATPFTEILLGEPGFNVSDDDVFVSTVNADTGAITVWNNSPEGIWIATDKDNIYQDFTAGNGDCIIRFGDGTHGAMPSIGTNILVMYAVTQGALGNNGGTGMSVLYPDDGSIQGLTTSSVSGGSDEKPASFYKAVAPYVFRAKNRAVTVSDYTALALAFPGVASVSVQAQRDVAPLDPRWANVVKICVLPVIGEKFNPYQWQKFQEYFKDKAHAAVQIVTEDPVKIPVNVNIRVAITKGTQPGPVKVQIEDRVRDLFAKGINSLGRMITRSDISQACRVTGVDYSEILTPQTDMQPLNKLSWFSPDNISVVVHYTDRSFSN